MYAEEFYDDSAVDRLGEPRLFFLLYNSTRTVSQGYGVAIVLTITAAFALAAGIAYGVVLNGGCELKFVSIVPLMQTESSVFIYLIELIPVMGLTLGKSGTGLKDLSYHHVTSMNNFA